MPDNARFFLAHAVQCFSLGAILAAASTLVSLLPVRAAEPAPAPACEMPPAGLAAWWDGVACPAGTVHDLQGSNHGMAIGGCLTAEGGGGRERATRGIR